MRTTLYNKTIPKAMALSKENPLPQFNVASYERPMNNKNTAFGDRGWEGRIATMFRIMLSPSMQFYEEFCPRL